MKYRCYYVVNELSDGLRAVHLLDENKKGKANFFLLNKINDNNTDISSHVLEGAIPALSVVEVDEKYRKLAEHLLGNVFIADVGNHCIRKVNTSGVISIIPRIGNVNITR